MIVLNMKRPSVSSARLRLALQHVVDEHHRRPQIGQEVGDAGAHELRRGHAVDAGRGLQDQAVENPVDLEDRAIDRLDRIVLLILSEGRGGPQADREHQPDDASQHACHPAAPQTASKDLDKRLSCHRRRSAR